jgi:cell division transport system permease protein
MTVIATSTIAISLFVLGVFLLIFFNLHNLLSTLNTKLDIVAYLKAGTSLQQIDGLQSQLPAITGVKKIEFVSKEAAWETFKEDHATLRLDDYVEGNPLPDSFKIEVKDLSYIHLVANKLSALEVVEDVRYGGDIAERVAHVTRIISSAGSILVIMLGLSTLMIVVNTIRLTVIARENEINIMQLVGATRSFIKRPFILEGIYIGLMGALLALTGLKIGYDLTMINIQKYLPFVPVNLNVKEVNIIFGTVVITGILLGWIGGFVSVSKSLKAD